MWFFASSIKIRATFETIFETLSAIEIGHVTIIGGLVYKKSMIFKVFGVYISASFWYFFMKSFLVLRSYWFLVINIKSVIMGALVTLETRLKVPILAVFDDLVHFWAVYFGTSL